MTDDKRKLFQETIARIRKHMRVTKVVCTRSVKGRSGDHYVGFSAGWDTVQDDSGGAADLITAQDGDVEQGNHDSGMTLKDARVATYVLGMQVDIAAHEAAFAGGSISVEHKDNAAKAIQANYGNLITAMLGED